MTSMLSAILAPGNADVADVNDLAVVSAVAASVAVLDALASAIDVTAAAAAADVVVVTDADVVSANVVAFITHSIL
jgi:hypothetical protein